MAVSTSQVSLSCAYFMCCKKHKAITLHLLVRLPGKARLVPSQQHKELHLLTKILKPWEGGIVFRHRCPACTAATQSSRGKSTGAQQWWTTQRWEEMAALLLWLKTCLSGKSCSSCSRASWGISTGIAHCCVGTGAMPEEIWISLAGGLLCDFNQNSGAATPGSVLHSGKAVCGQKGSLKSLTFPSAPHSKEPPQDILVCSSAGLLMTNFL